MAAINAGQSANKRYNKREAKAAEKQYQKAGQNQEVKFLLEEVGLTLE